MFLGILTLITALSISAVAIYYSVAGLVAIFAAAAVPIIIMGTVLEIAKLVTAVWLHYYWDKTVWWLKTYLGISVVVLMFITSMGIFGFLSRAHIEQTASANESVARIERIDLEIQRQQAIIVAAQESINKVETAGSNNDQEIQEKIDVEQDRIDSAYSRIQPAIDEQNKIIEQEQQTLSTAYRFIEEQIQTIDKNISNLDSYQANNQIRELQALVGVRVDGRSGPATRAAVDAYRQARLDEKARLIESLNEARAQQDTSKIDAARAEIQRLRQSAEQIIQDSNQLIFRLRAQLGTEDRSKTEEAITQEQEKIRQAEIQIANLNEEKFNLEAEYRKLEAEVGPIKYIAEFVYGDSTDKDLLEEAVRWVIITIIFVFDPLAVLLLIASQYTFGVAKEKKANQQRTTDEKHYKPDDVDTANKSESRNENSDRDSITARIKTNIDGTIESYDTLLRTGSQGRSLGPNKTTLKVPTDGTIQSITVTANHDGRIVIPKDNDANTDAGHVELEQFEIQLDETEQARRQQVLEESELSEDAKISKQKWKEENPNQNIKFWKDQYIKGKIDELPWTGYVQNSEQSDSSLWNRLRSKDE